MSEKHDLAVLIGRFQPFHNGHLDACLQVLDRSEHLLILVGSAYQASTIKNPFTAPERILMIKDALLYAGVDMTRIVIEPIRDFPYSDDRWVAQVVSTAHSVAESMGIAHRDLAIAGLDKDESSYYLNLFPFWDDIRITQSVDLSATTVRTMVLGGNFLGRTAGSLIPEAVAGRIGDLMEQAPGRFSQLHEEWHYYANYPDEWGNGPFLTADTLVTCGGHVLVIERGGCPGKGLLALPGGFVNPNERIVDAALRELREEVGIKVPLPVLRGSITGSQQFDHPKRSLRGRVVTSVYRIRLFDATLPKLKAGTDAAQAFWMPISEALESPDRFFEDHAMILEEML